MSEDVGLGLAEAIALAVIDLDVDAGDAGAVAPRADDGAAGGLLDLAVASDMVAVMVGVQDMGDLPAALCRLGEHRPATAGSTTPTAPLCGSRINHT